MRFVAVAVLICFLLTPALLADVISYADFTSTAGLTLNGSAARAGNVLRLTSAGSQAGSAWFATPVYVTGGFHTEFDFTVTGITNPFSDGFAFVIQNAGTGALGGSGGGLGYSGILDSLAIEFDTHQNYFFDPNDHHLAIQSCGTGANTSDHGACNLGLATPSGLTSFAGTHNVVIDYVPGTLTIDFDGAPTLVRSLDIGTKLNLAGGTAYVGFTGGTGGGVEYADIRDWTYDVPEPATTLLFATGLFGIARLLRRQRRQR